MKAATNVDHLVTVLGISNSVLHIIESILSKEESLDFFEERFPFKKCVKILAFQSPLLNDDTKIAALNKARGKVVRLAHHQLKFQEHFAKDQDVFFPHIWQLATSRQLNPKKSCNLV
jgi:hypothetical protein